MRAHRPLRPADGSTRHAPPAWGPAVASDGQAYRTWVRPAFRPWPRRGFYPPIRRLTDFRRRSAALAARCALAIQETRTCHLMYAHLPRSQVGRPFTSITTL